MLEKTKAWLARLLKAEGTAKPITGKELLEALGGGAATHAGVTVNERTAMCVSAVFSCVGLIGGAIGSLPLQIYEVGRDGTRKKPDHYADNAIAELWWLLNQRPQPHISAAVFWEYLVWSLLLHGDALARIDRANSGRVVGFTPWHPERVAVKPHPTVPGWLVYHAPDESGRMQVYDHGDVIHVPGLGWDGMRGMSVIRHAARQSLGIALASEEFSARFFGNGAKPDIALEVEGELDETSVDTLRKTWAARYGGVMNSHLPAVLTGGMKVKELTMNADDAALIATRDWQVRDIARIFGVPPFMIGDTEKTSSWGTGVESMGIGFVKYTLQRHLTKIEQELNNKLFYNARDRRFCEFNVEGLLRGDSKTRSEFYKAALGGSSGPGWMTPREVRSLENMPAEPDGELAKWSPDAKQPAPTAG